MLRQMNGRKEAKRKKNGGWTREGFFWIPLPPVFIHFLITFVSFFLSFAFCPIGFSLPGFLKKIEIPRQGEGRVGLTVGFTFSWKAILLSKEMASVDLELSSFSLLKGIDFLCKCYSSFCVLADLKTHRENVSTHERNNIRITFTKNANTLFTKDFAEWDL